MLRKFKVKEAAPRLVILGNSNVGKSSITRFLLKNKSLAIGKIGKKAGSTITLNLYKDPKIPFQIADLPGFGAMTTVSKDKKEKVHDAIIKYVEQDKENIFLAIVIFNCVRINDELDKWYYGNVRTIPLSYEFITWLNELELPSIVVLNKIDKLKKRELTEIDGKIRQVFSDLGVKIVGLSENSGLLDIMQVSVKDGTNMKDLRSIVENIFERKFPNYNPDDIENYNNIQEPTKKLDNPISRVKSKKENYSHGKKKRYIKKSKSK